METRNQEIMLSIIVVTYNHEKYVTKCMQSIFQQEIPYEYEVILADDCSSDNTVQTVKQLYGDQVVYNTQKANMGLCYNMWDNFLKCRGKYVYVCAGDDYLLGTDMFQRHIQILQDEPEVFSVSYWMEVVDERDQVTRIRKYAPEYTLEDFLKGVPSMIHIGTCRNTFKEDAGEYLIQGARNNEEIQMFYYVLTKGKIKVVPKPYYAYCYRVSDQNYNSRNTYYDMVKDYILSFHAIEKVDRGKYRFSLAKYYWYDRYMSRMRKARQYGQLLKLFSMMDREELFDYFRIKLGIKFNAEHKIPDKFLTDKFLIKKKEI